MRKTLFGALVAALMCVSVSASADPLFGGDHPLRLGFGMDVGVPSGASLGLVVHPKMDWVSVQPSLTYNGLAFGGRLAVKLDPLALINTHRYADGHFWTERASLPIGLFADVQGGFFGQGSIPGGSNLPSLGYDYLNLYGGLRLGKANGFHWNFEGGPTYLHATAGNFQSVVGNSASGLTIANPTIDGWVCCTFVTGFEVVWP